MRDKFRKTSNLTSSSKIDPRNASDIDRSRGREKDRNARPLRRSHSRSPKRSRLAAPLTSVRGREDPRYRFEQDTRPRPGEGKNRLDYDAGRKGKSVGSSQGRLRMDNQIRGYEVERNRKYPDVSERNPSVKDGVERNSGMKKGPGNFELDRVMKRAREERSSFWNKKVLEAEEKDPHRWGHSGFKELYRRDMRRSRSMSPFKSSFSKRRAPLEHPQRRSRSRSRSPIMKGIGASNNRPRSTRDVSPLMSRRTQPPLTKVKSMARNRSPLISNSPMSLLHSRDRKKDNGFTTKPRLGNDKLGTIVKPVVGNKPRTSVQTLKPKPGLKRGLDTGRKVNNRNSRSRSSSVSISSDSLGSSPYLPPSNRSSSSKHELSFQGKGSRKKSNSRSISGSSSSSTSSDDDVLQLHPKSKGRSRSLSYSDSSSSVSDSSASVKLSTRNKTTTRTSSSSSSRSSSSDYDAEKRRKVQEKSKKISSGGKKATTVAAARKAKHDAVKRKGNKKLGPSDIDSNSSSSEIEEVAVVPKPTSTAKSNPKPTATKTAPAASTKTDTNSAAKGTAPQKTSTNKEKPSAPNKSGTGAVSQSGESDSDSDSSSDSVDSEPKMTLSERFAKLTQMSTDKREYAKPVLSVNEIDTKLKVVKDLRNADTKVYVDGASTTQTNYPPRGRVRPKSPDYAEGEKRYTADERRRHFEKMSKDEPTDRPADWSDTRVRYYYYRDRGYFNDRPLSLEEYVKWEDWWYKYRDWLQNEGLLNRMSQQHQGHFSGNNHTGSSGGNWNHGQMDNSSRPRPYNNAMGSRRVERMPAPLLSNRPNFGRPEGNAYLQNQIPIGRRIGRTPAGSLVVNIRQGNNFAPRDKRVALNRPR